MVAMRLVLEKIYARLAILNKIAGFRSRISLYDRNANDKDSELLHAQSKTSSHTLPEINSKCVTMIVGDD